MTFYKYPPIEKQLENLNNGLYRSAHLDGWFASVFGSLGYWAKYPAAADSNPKLRSRSLLIIIRNNTLVS